MKGIWRWAGTALLIHALLFWPGIAAAQTDARAAWSVASPSIFEVEPTWPGYARPGFGAPAGTAPEGTGIAVLKSGVIATALHVVAKATEIHVRAPDGTVLPAELLRADPRTDLAFLRIDAETVPIRLAEDRPETGAPVCALSNAFGLGIGITCGVVSANRRSGVGFNRVEDFLQTDAALNPGSSGGALVDLEGRLVGLLSAIFTKDSDANIGVNFAVSTELLLKSVPPELR
ncbi:trypsin-like peptidase domain-containing protein [Nisaea acidiphila]|uniref:Trypsin-like peptidase domain-containing protein n=1 Tax=Nisaea acidiphila TaxID=1862145 RepID=A0A9J7ASR3_9PROT|nr:trypsin-like peptidase domain-containing protein [Nisaea acidiphila]UUX49537.1 trypsin-like peptidase domain-containing protein [Nisaea acidiphila]